MKRFVGFFEASILFADQSQTKFEYVILTIKKCYSSFKNSIFISLSINSERHDSLLHNTEHKENVAGNYMPVSINDDVLSVKEGVDR